MAAEMKETQQQEIDKMLAIRARLGADSKLAAMRDPHAELDMAELEAAAGEQVDAVVLTNMVPQMRELSRCLIGRSTT